MWQPVSKTPLTRSEVIVPLFTDPFESSLLPVYNPNTAVLKMSADVFISQLKTNIFEYIFGFFNPECGFALSAVLSFHLMITAGARALCFKRLINSFRADSVVKLSVKATVLCALQSHTNWALDTTGSSITFSNTAVVNCLNSLGGTFFLFNQTKHALRSLVKKNNDNLSKGS